MTVERLNRNTNGITFKSTSVMAMDRSVQFDVNPVGANEKLVCRLMGNGPDDGAVLQIYANTYGKFSS